MQIQLPNGEFYDIVGIKLLENKIIGSKDTHRLVLSCKKPVESMGDPIKIFYKLSGLNYVTEKDKF